MMKNDDITMVRSLINHIGIGICLCGDDGAFILAKTMSSLLCVMWMWGSIGFSSCYAMDVRYAV